MNSLHALDCSLVGTPGWPVVGSLDFVDSDVLWDDKSVVFLPGTLSAGNLLAGNTCTGIPLDDNPPVGVPWVGISYVGIPLVGIRLGGIPLVVGILYAGIPYAGTPVNYIDSNESTQRLPSSARSQSDLEQHHLHNNYPAP